MSFSKEVAITPSNLTSVREALYLVLAFILPVFLPLINTLLILLSIIFLVDAFNKKIRFKVDYSVLLLPSIFFIYAITLLYTQDFFTGISKLETKSWLLPFPIIISFYSLSDRLLKNIKLAFVLGCIVACLICIFNAIYVGYVKTGELVFAENQFFYDRDFFVSAVKLHPPYFGLYLATAILFIGTTKIEKISKGTEITVKAILLTILIVTLLLIQARMAQLSLLFIVILSLSIYSFQKRKPIVLLSGFILLTSLTVFAFAHPFFNKRITEVINTPLREPTFSESSSVSLRYAQIYCAAYLIELNPVLGVGVGDAQNELNECYISRNYSPVLSESNMNSHNQYLDVAISAGIVGLIVFVSLIALLLSRFYTVNKTAFYFTILIFLAALTEAIFNSYKGIAFFSFLCSVFMTKRSQKYNLNKSSHL